MTTEHDTHPSPAQYWKIAALLAVLTVFEVAMFYIDRELGLGALNALILISLALLKFVITCTSDSKTPSRAASSPPVRSSP